MKDNLLLPQKNIYKRVIIHILLAIILCPVLSAQPSRRNDSEVDRLILAYTFYIKQKISLDFITDQYPTLQEYITLANNEWNREFRYSIENIDSILTTKLKDKWATEKAALIYKFSKADNSGVTEEKAKEFIYTVSERASGKIQTPVLEIYLAYNPLYNKCPDAEFSDGYVRKVTTKELCPTFPLNLKITYPKSWKESVNKKGKLSLKCISGYGLGSVVMSVTAEPARNEYSKDAIIKLLSKENLQKIVPPTGTLLTYTPDLVVHNCPCACIDFYYKDQRQESKTETYVSYYKNFRITVTFSISSVFPNTQNIPADFDKYRKLFTKIIENIVILSQWGL